MAVMTCPQCQSFTGANDQFCSMCGSPLQSGGQQVSEVIEDSPENDVVGTCDKCGAGIGPGQLYCTSCGAAQLGDSGD